MANLNRLRKSLELQKKGTTGIDLVNAKKKKIANSKNVNNEPSISAPGQNPDVTKKSLTSWTDWKGGGGSYTEWKAEQNAIRSETPQVESNVNNDPYKKGSDSYNLVVGALGEQAEFANEIGLESSPTTISGIVRQHEDRQKEEREYLDQIQKIESEVESSRFNASKDQANSAKSATEANFSQSREGPIGSSASQLISNFKGRVDEQIKNQERIIRSNELRRNKLKEDLLRAQSSQDSELAESIRGQIANADQSIKNAENRSAELANDSISLSLQIDEQKAASRSQAFDFFSSSGSGVFKEMSVPDIMEGMGVDQMTASMLKSFDTRRSTIDPTSPDYLIQQAQVTKAINEAKWAGMSPDQKNFEYYRNLVDQDPAAAQEFAEANGITEKSFFSDFNQDWDQKSTQRDSFFAKTGSLLPVQSKYAYDATASGGVSFERSLPSGTVLETRGECGMFVNDCLNGGPGLFGDTFKQKMSKVNSNFPTAGGAFVEDTGDTTAHVGMIEETYPDMSFDVRESNYTDTWTVSTAHVAAGSERWKAIVERGGFYVPGGAPEAARGTPSTHLNENPTFKKYAQALADDQLSVADLKSMGMSKGDIGALQTEALELEPRNSPNGLNKEQRSNYITLKNQYRSRPEVQDFKGVQSAYVKIKAASSTAAGDLSMIFNYMKLLDPGSVVREGEFANAQNATGVPQRVINIYNKVKEGTRLSDVQRKDFLTQADNVFTSSKSVFDKVVGEFKGDALILGLPQDINYTLGGLDVEEASDLGKGSSDANPLSLDITPISSDADPLTIN